MRQAAGRLPVHLLLDIDGTLLCPCYRRYWHSEDGEGLQHADGQKQELTTAPWSARVLCPFSCDKCCIQHVLLRPHVIPLLKYLLVDRALDTPTTQVHTSLYTRQSASYCAAVVRQVLLPALRQCCPGTSADVLPSLFYRLFDGSHCVQTAGVQARTDAQLPPNSTAASCAVPIFENWSKTISISPSPLTTVLVDDSSHNLRSPELTTGHAVLLPSFRPGADDFDTDACLAVRIGEEVALYDALRGGGTGDALGSDESGETVPLLSLLAAFVQACDVERGTIEELQRTLPFSYPYEAEAVELHQQELQARIKAHSAALSAVSFFDASPAYREVWNRFHAAREQLLVPYL
ncbi:hypothetical protein ABL78_2388 [Leptomonas seymouri]|uniref:FCP1 homology domain-containing protein n=1 Tax=Leptomonas seymouri TaxID=5684 RepID=A0A0N1I650_LEPSE|nr:hypothetical protein ABL78_2388 [Leptomonas seymouri]|eukprot:KPI88492.1 hypothetical protein ABL78_2388 [Leptomonas seymouri]